MRWSWSLNNGVSHNRLNLSLGTVILETVYNVCQPNNHYGYQFDWHECEMKLMNTVRKEMTRKGSSDWYTQIVDGIQLWAWKNPGKSPKNSDSVYLVGTEK